MKVSLLEVTLLTSSTLPTLSMPPFQASSRALWHGFDIQIVAIPFFAPLLGYKSAESQSRVFRMCTYATMPKNGLTLASAQWYLLNEWVKKWGIVALPSFIHSFNDYMLSVCYAKHVIYQRAKMPARRHWYSSYFLRLPIFASLYSALEKTGSSYFKCYSLNILLFYDQAWLWRTVCLLVVCNFEVLVLKIGYISPWLGGCCKCSIFLPVY